MADTDFKAGDVVRVKSGGPDMTVSEIGDELGVPSAFCVWFEKTKQMSGSFPLTVIEKAPRSGPSIGRSVHRA